ncbi:hypothetical protein GGR51DRAFT_507861 [Nemania sp. FL0031]|nr:hypothetical protein GGR51DRAFT_507861 [Nemania sp. FL0031]
MSRTSHFTCVDFSVIFCCFLGCSAILRIYRKVLLCHIPSKNSFSILFLFVSLSLFYVCRTT